MPNDRLTSKKVKNFLNGTGVSPVPVVVGPYVPEAPDRIAVVTFQSGPGLTLETLFENRVFQLRVRGAQNNYEDAEELALDLDDIFLNLDYPWEPSDDGGQAYVTSLTWAGGGPAPLNVAEGSYRYSFTCNYVARAATGVGQ